MDKIFAIAMDIPFIPGTSAEEVLHEALYSAKVLVDMSDCGDPEADELAEAVWEVEDGGPARQRMLDRIENEIQGAKW